MREAFVGIDVACAKRKRLPINISILESNRLTPLPLRDSKIFLPPASEGNIKTLDDKWLNWFATATAKYLRNVENHYGVCIRRVAIDAPSDPKSNGKNLRQAELELNARGIKFFQTPSKEEFAKIKQKGQSHLKRGGVEANIPHANQLWMLVGFALFQRLRQEWGREVIEVYPQATVKVLGASGFHKSTRDGLSSQIIAVAKFTGWPQTSNTTELRNTCYGKLNDCLDAYLAAWVASLNETSREPLGVRPDDVNWIPPDDVIWIPRIRRDV